MDLTTNRETIQDVQENARRLFTITVPFHKKDFSVCRLQFPRQVLELIPHRNGRISLFDVRPSSVYNMTGYIKVAVGLLAHVCTLLSV